MNHPGQQSKLIGTNTLIKPLRNEYLTPYVTECH